MAGNPWFPPPKRKVLGCWARFTLTLAILSSSPATAELEKDTQRMCLPPTLPWPVGFSENWKRMGKKEVCGFVPAFTLCMWEHYPHSSFLLTKLLWTYFSYWTDHLNWLQRQREKLCVKHKKKGEQCAQPIKVKAKKQQWQLQCYEKGCKYFVLCKKQKTCQRGSKLNVRKQF